MNGVLPSARSVRAIVFALVLERDTSIEVAARHLRTSTRSLQRHLAQLGTSYREIVEEAKVVTACGLLVESDLSIFEIACRLGYAGPSSFSRTFSRVMKIPPGAYRRSHKMSEAGLAKLRPQGLPPKSSDATT